MSALVLPQVHNVAFAFELMQEGGLKKPKARPEGICYYITKSHDLKIMVNNSIVGVLQQQ